MGECFIQKYFQEKHLLIFSVISGYYGKKLIKKQKKTGKNAFFGEYEDKL